MAKNCINCSSPLPDEAVFCPRCGTKQPDNASSCPRCGAPVPSGGAFCTICGTPLNAAPAQTVPQPAEAPQPMQAPPVQQTPPQQQNTTIPKPAQQQYTYAPQTTTPVPAQAPAKPKKSKKKWVITGVGVGALALAAVLFFVFILPLFGKTAGDKIVFKNGSSEYYASPLAFKLNGDNPPELISVSGEDYSYLYLYPEISARDGKSFYCVNSKNLSYDDEDWLVKYDLSSATSATQEHWVDNDALKNCVFSNSDGDKPSAWLSAVRDLSFDNGWIYFDLQPDMEHMLMQGDIMGKVGRISKDGKTIEQIGDINAYEMITDGGWIYYADCGYDPSSDGRPSTINDFSHAGIYKIKPDGSGKKLLHAFQMSEEQKRNYYTGQFRFSGDMKIIDGKLWFLDYSSAGQGRLCRMDTNGGGYETISNFSCTHYAVDGNTAYLYTYSGYSEGSSMWISGYYEYSNDSPILYQMDIKTKTETQMPFVRNQMNDMTCHNGYLYFNSYRFTLNDSSSGLRINLKTGAAQWLVIRRESSWKTDPDTGSKYFDQGTPEISWETVDLK